MEANDSDYDPNKETKKEASGHRPGAGAGQGRGGEEERKGEGEEKRRGRGEGKEERRGQEEESRPKNPTPRGCLSTPTNRVGCVPAGPG